MRILDNSNIILVAGGAVTPTNGGPGAAGPYSTLNGLSNGASAISTTVKDGVDAVAGFVAGVFKGMWEEA